MRSGAGGRWQSLSNSFPPKPRALLSVVKRSAFPPPQSASEQRELRTTTWYSLHTVIASSCEQSPDARQRCPPSEIDSSISEFQTLARTRARAMMFARNIRLIRLRCPGQRVQRADTKTPTSYQLTVSNIIDSLSVRADPNVRLRRLPARSWSPPGSSLRDPSREQHIERPCRGRSMEAVRRKAIFLRGSNIDGRSHQSSQRGDADDVSHSVAAFRQTCTSEPTSLPASTRKLAALRLRSLREAIRNRRQRNFHCFQVSCFGAEIMRKREKKHAEGFVSVRVPSSVRIALCFKNRA